MRVNIPRALLVIVLLAAAGSWRLATSAQGVTEAERQLQKAILLETVDGNLQAAIEQYKKIVAENGSSRVVAAKALLRLAGCYVETRTDRGREDLPAVDRPLCRPGGRGRRRANATGRSDTRTRHGIRHCDPAGVVRPGSGLLGQTVA